LKITVSKITLLCDLFARLSIRLSTTRSCRPLADWYSNATVLAGTGVQMFRPRKKTPPPEVRLTRGAHKRTALDIITIYKQIPAANYLSTVKLQQPEVDFLSAFHQLTGERNNYCMPFCN